MVRENQSNEERRTIAERDRETLAGGWGYKEGGQVERNMRDETLRKLNRGRKWRKKGQKEK
jgi:hypothetical protein